MRILSHKLADADTRSQKERENRQIARLRELMVFFLRFAQAFAALHGVKEVGDLIRLQTYDILIAYHGKVHKGRGVMFDFLFFEEVFIKRTYRRQLSCLCALMVEHLGVFFVGVKGDVS